MSADRKEYIRIPGRGVKLVTSTKLWAGKTHLLLVCNVFGYSEKYRRFYYRDIQSITCSRNARGRKSNIFLAAMSAILLACLLFSLNYGYLPTFLGVFLAFLSAIFFVFLAVNLIAGPTCTTIIRTAVGSEELISLRRLRRAVKAMDFLRPLIEKAQKGIETVAPDAATVEAALSAKSSTRAGLPSVKNRMPTFTNYSGWAHLVFFGVMIAGGTCYAASLLPGLRFARYPGGLLSIAATFVAIFAVIKQKGSRLEKGLRRTTCVSMTYVFLTYIGLIAFMVVYGVAKFISGASGSADPGMQLFVMTFTNPRLRGFAHTAEWGSLLLMSVYSIAAGIYGLARTLFSRKRYG